MNVLLERLGRFMARHAWQVVAAWLLVLVGLVLADRTWGGTFANDYTVPGSESSRGLDRLDRDDPSAGGYAGQIVFHAERGTVVDASPAIATTMKNVGALPDVLRATDPLTTDGTPAVSADQTIAYGTVAWSTVPASLGTDYLDRLDRAVEPARDAGLVVEYGGGAGQIGQQADDRLSEAIGLACALLLLLLMFGSFVAAAIPLLAAVFSVGSGLALVGLVASLTSFPTTAPTVATLLGLGVAVDYGLFMVARHREQVDLGVGEEDSIARTAGTSGAAIVVAGSTVVIAILGLYVSGVPFVGALGAASAIVVTVTMAAALTLTCALLALAGSRVRSRGDRRHDPAAATPDPESSAFARWGRRVSDHPWPWGVASVVVLVVLAVPLLSLRLGQLDAGTDPPEDSSRRAYDLVEQGFGPGANGPLTVVLALPSSGDSQDLLTRAQTALEGTHGVASVTGPSLSPSKSTALFNVVPTTAPDAAATSTLVDTLRGDVLPSLDAPATYVVGTVAGYVDFTEKTAQRLPWLILAVVLLSLVLLTLAFRAPVIAVKAAILNLLSVGAAYGVVIAVFQFGWGSGLLGVDQDLPIPAFVPMLMFAIVFGLSMDYEVFLLSRVHEAWVRTGDAHRAVALGIGSTARVITTAAAIMVVVFTSFVLDDDPTIKMLAVGMAVAVLIDASVVRMVLVPAVMSVLDERAWYLPAWLDRVLPDLEFEGSVGAPDGAAPGGDAQLPRQRGEPDPAPSRTPADR